MTARRINHHEYVHGYSEREAERLADQASGLRELLHHDTEYPAGARVLEAGCGVGAQTVILAPRSPEARFLSVDISPDSLRKAEETVREAGIGNVEFQQANLYALEFADESFDHVFVCFVLEHLQDPPAALRELRRVLKTGGTLTAIEGDHGSCYFHPETPESRKAWQCLVDAQAEIGGNSLIGRQLYPLLREAGLRDLRVTPRMVYGDAGKPGLVDSFWEKTIIPMVEGVKPQALEHGFMDEESWAKGIADLHLVSNTPAGTFCYNFFKGVGRR